MAEAYMRQAFVHVAIGQYESAAKAFRRGLGLRSNWRGAALRLDTIYGGADLPKMQHLANLAKAVEDNPFDSDLLLVLGLVLYFDGQIDRAQLCFSRLSQLGGDDDRLLSDLKPQPKPAGAADPPPGAAGKIAF
jgi:tetratricopeptide (TPR) repeat protein